MLQKILLSMCKKASKYNGNTAICVGQNNVLYWASEISNKCFSYQSSNLKTLIGTGRRGFSNATSLTRSMIDRPKGLVCNGSNVYISDSGNGCIRQVNKGSKTIFGNPLNNKRHLSKLATNKSSLYALSNNEVFHILLGSNHATSAYKTDKIISIATDDLSNLYVVEEV